MTISIVPCGSGEYLIRTFWDKGYVTLGVILKNPDGGWAVYCKSGGGTNLPRLREARYWAKEHDWSKEMARYGA